ncbi:DUF3987 domain-containing protein [Prevotella communis]|uniref:DUF3987 domain-containing protein n=1 Tax=Prevotella communis TaxID=2913614 RepID=UPI001EDA23AA|nr:DUF3987 domain-containing protein [Prevotella communis]UKK61546.1 DUF3987 domain-containing protein [Prevotella communis]UKK64372.1 DUF3987 domain-containing protein [Prevotella communis]
MASSFSGKPRKASMAAYRQLLAKNHVEEILQDVKQNNRLDRKKELPVWLPLAQSFNNGTRKAEDAVPSGLFYLDIDEKGLTEQLWQKVQDENLIEEYRIVYFAESAGGGTHIWAWRTPGATIEEDIQKLASRLGVSYDSHVTDLARCCFMASEKYVKLLDPIVFEEQPSSPKLGDNRGLNEESPLTEKNENGSETCSAPQPPNLGGSNYKGIPYENIVQALLWKLGYGDAPAEGERNMALYTMSRYMRFICDFDEQKLFTILPHWGLSDHEVQSTIKSAVGSTRPAGIPSMMNEVLSSLGAATEAGSAESEESTVAPVDNELPGILQDLSDHAPEEFREATLMAAMPMLGTLATGIRAKYRDGKLNSPSFIVDIEAPQATGKSFVDAEFELLMDPIIKQDEVEWQKEIEYSLAKKNGEEVENPCAQIRIIEPNIGVSAFLERALYAKGKHLFTYAPEIETVLKNNKGGAWTEKNDLFRLAYDNKPWGQHRISKDSFSGKVTLYYNMVMCGTPNKCRAFFADAESGLVSRVTPVLLPDMVGARMPHFKPWSQEDEEKVKRQCLCLMDEEGEIELPLINKAIEAWDEEKRQEYLQTLRYSLDVLRRRAALNGFRAGIIAYLLEGRQETERAIRFAVWYAERCLHYQLQLYGNKIDALHDNAVSPQASKGNIRYLDVLPKEFTKEDLVNLRLANNESPVVKTIICRWVKEGLVVKTNANLWQKIQV